MTKVKPQAFWGIVKKGTKRVISTVWFEGTIPELYMYKGQCRESEKYNENYHEIKKIRCEVID